MSDTRLMQYVGFDSKDKGREYRFQVRYTTEDTREFTLTIRAQLLSLTSFVIRMLLTCVP